MSLEILRALGSQKPNFVNKKYETKLEFLEGYGGNKVWIFSGTVITSDFICQKDVERVLMICIIT